MKIPITFKMPDAIYYALKDAGFDAEEDEAAFEELCEQWIGDGEYVTIEIDTEEKTAVVLEQ